jgi:hypothetical protein
MLVEDQMGLFGEIVLKQEAAPAAPIKDTAPPRKKETSLPRKAESKKAQPASKVIQPVKKVSGLVPEGDVRLTANIRQDLHLKLKIASAHRRTTIGEILEDLVEKYI